MSAVRTSASILALGVGGGLIYAAFTGQSPLNELRKALETGKLDGPPEGGRSIATVAPTPIGEPGATYNIGTVPKPDPAAGSTATGPLNLVPIGQGSHRLAAPAAAAFAAWERAYGAKIIVTDSYRSQQQQAAGNAADPGRFASASGSAHPMGLAVDVNLPITTGGQSRKGQARYDRLAAAGASTGWRSYTGGVSGDTWHFSYGVVK